MKKLSNLIFLSVALLFVLPSEAFAGGPFSSPRSEAEQEKLKKEYYPLGDAPSSFGSLPLSSSSIARGGSAGAFGLKFGPILYDFYKPVGAEVGFDIGLGPDALSLCIFGRQNFGIDSTRTQKPVESHTIIEAQIRFWPDDVMSGVLMAPLVKFYTTGEFGGGFVFGYQLNTGGFTMEAFGGVQSKTSVENANLSPLLLRYGLNIGFFIE